MRATLLEDKLTPLTAQDMIRALREAFFQLTGNDPTDKTLAILTAQSALETGRWKSIHWFNVSNIKAGQDYEGFYTLYRCNELIGGKLVWFSPPHVQCRFRAYPDIVAGARDHLGLLSKRARFYPAWTAARGGDEERFVDALKQGGFFTADLAPYKRAVLSLTAEYLRLIRDMVPPTMRPPPHTADPEHSATSDEDMGRLLPLVWDEEEWQHDRDDEVTEKI